MPDNNPGFTVTDRRKFTLEGDLREDAAPSGTQAPANPEPSPEPSRSEARPATAPPESPRRGPQLVSNEAPAPQAASEPVPSVTPGEDPDGYPELPEISAAETAEQHAAYQQSTRDLDEMVAQSNPSARHAAPSEMNFDRLVQSIYMTAAIQLGAGAQPGEQPRVDIMGARQSIDMLNVLTEKTRGNLTDKEQRLLQNALFELRMTFLEITNAIAANAARPPKPGSPR
jgi:hypothetical protein